jgi:hypothetical protein
MTRPFYAAIVVAFAALVLVFATHPAPVTAQAPVTMSPSSPDVVTLGSTADAATGAGATGTISGKLRQVSDDIEDIRALLAGTRSINVAQVGGVSVVATKCEDYAKLTTATFTASVSGNTQVVGLTSATTIYVCRIVVNVAGAVVVQPIYGIGTACATGETSLDSWAFTAATAEPWGIANTGGIQYKTAASNAFCLDLSASVAVTGSVLYVKE